MVLSQDRYPRLNIRNEVFDIMYDYKHEGLDIGDAYDMIFDLIANSVMTFPKQKKRGSTARSYPRSSLPASPRPRKRALSAWNKFVRANSKKPRFKFANGKLKLKQMGIAFRKTPAGRKRK